MSASSICSNAVRRTAKQYKRPYQAVTMLPDTLPDLFNPSGHIVLSRLERTFRRLPRVTIA